MSDPKDLLLEALQAQRAHVLGILEGLDEASLRQPSCPSGWTCLGLVQHLTLDVERFWFHQVVAGEPVDELLEGGTAWTASPNLTPEAVFARYRAEIARANAIIAATPLDAAPRWWPDFFGDWRLADLTAVLLHVITETACHAGHLDVVRELFDGRTWLVL